MPANIYLFFNVLGMYKFFFLNKKSQNENIGYAKSKKKYEDKIILYKSL